MTNCLELRNIKAGSTEKNIINNISLKIEKGSISIVMGPNGAGKSTISNIIMGNEKYFLEKGEIIFEDKNINELSTNERFKLGIFMSFQNPVEIDGITLTNFLRTSYNISKNKNLNVKQFHDLLTEKLDFLGLDHKFRSRYLNKGFSGGEKKKIELLQLLLFEPKLAILDEIDSGLDIDSLKLVSKVIDKLNSSNKTSFLIITHNPKLLSYINANEVHILKKGKIVESGKKDLIKKIEEKGFN